ncbi:MAG: glycosyltransferase family 2 protein [Ruminococcus sp.]|nr:glycosyltransferase family 2 protein [Ruminococcus sp.]
MTKLYIAVPCYNEEEVLKDSAHKLLHKLNEMIGKGTVSDDSKIVFIDDGSKDRTWEIIGKLHDETKMVQGIKLTGNCGHQNALLCGLMTLKDKCDAIISIDADLQDDIDVFDEMIEKYEDGCDVVYGVRSKRDSDTFFKRFSAKMYYKILNHLGAKIVVDHADFRLMSARALESFSQFKEVNLFLRGMVPMVGYKSAIVTYERKERLYGESKYSLKDMIALAVEGVTSLSIRPIKLIAKIGLLIFLVSIAMLIYTLVRYFMGATEVGWASLAVSIWAIGGLQLLAIGVIGEYIGKIYLETKARPRYIVETYLDDDE